VSTANITREAGENVSIVTDYMIGDLPTRIVGASAQSPKRVPEPSTVLLLGGAAAGLIALGWKRRR
jgi:PEP-CTERM motif